MATHIGWRAALAIVVATARLLRDLPRRAAGALAPAAGHAARAARRGHRRRREGRAAAGAGLGDGGARAVHRLDGAQLALSGAVSSAAFSSSSASRARPRRIRAASICARRCSSASSSAGWSSTAASSRGGSRPCSRACPKHKLYLGATILTAFNDNALITYLATLVPNLDDRLKLAVVEGAVTGGGLTVIANAPNPAGQALLAQFFDGAVLPIGLLAGALLPTLIAIAAFRSEDPCSQRATCHVPATCDVRVLVDVRRAPCDGPRNTISSMLNAVSFVLASSLTFAQAAPSQSQAPAPHFVAGRRTAARGSDSDAGRPTRSREIQGHDQGTHAVRRSPAGHGSQSRGGRLDRGAAQELRLPAPSASSTSTSRLSEAPRPAGSAADAVAAARGASQGNKRPGQGGSTIFGTRGPHRRQQRSQPAARREAARAELAAGHRRPARGGLLHEGRQQDARARCTSSAPTWTAIGWGEAANDDGSGTALVMELARIFSSPDVQTDRTDPLRALEQRGDRTERRARLRRAAAGAAGQGEPGGVGEVSRAEVARHDSARHDDVRSRHAAGPTARSVRSSGARPTSTSSSR